MYVADTVDDSAAVLSFVAFYLITPKLTRGAIAGHTRRGKRRSKAGDVNKLLSAYECTYRQLFIWFVECVIISLPNHVSLTGRLPPSRLCTCLCKYSLPLSPILPHYPLFSLTIPYSPSLSSILPHYPLFSLNIPYSPSLFPILPHYSLSTLTIRSFPHYLFLPLNVCMYVCVSVLLTTEALIWPVTALLLSVAHRSSTNALTTGAVKHCKTTRRWTWLNRCVARQEGGG